MEKIKYALSLLSILIMAITLSACGEGVETQQEPIATSETVEPDREYRIQFMYDREQIGEDFVKNGDIIERPEEPQKDGYIFSHWATHQRSTDGSEIFDFDVPFDSDNWIWAFSALRIYAYFQVYRIEFDTNTIEGRGRLDDAQFARMVATGDIPHNVTHLTLRGGDIQDISPISELTDIVELTLLLTSRFIPRRAVV